MCNRETRYVFDRNSKTVRDNENTVTGFFVWHEIAFDPVPRRVPHDEYFPRYVIFYAIYLPYWTKFLEALPARDRIDKYKRMSLADRKPLHRRELMRARRVRDLQRAYIFITAYNLKQCTVR